VFIAVGTPTRRGDGHADLTYVYAAAAEVADALRGYTVVVTKSTVPVGTGREVARIIRETQPSAEFDVCSNPEFLREGAAIADFKHPDRIVVGTDDEHAREVLREIYRPLFLNKAPILFTGRRTAELTKYAANAFLATKISFINEIADLCEAVGADVQEVARGIGLDNRIGPKFLHPGPGYGGSCFPKDTLALIRMAQEAGAELAHMWHFHGSYGFRHSDPAYPFGIRSKKLPDWTPGVLEASVRMSWILVDADGRRFMNEYQPYVHDTGHRFFDRYDPTTMRFPALPAFMVFDEPGRAMYPVARSFINDPDIAPYEWSDDNLKEVELGILKRAGSVEELAVAMGVEHARLAATLARWNELCSSGGPDPLGRPAATRLPVSRPPYYFGEMWPVVSNTQGALAHDVEQRVLNPFGEPIGHLYVAGELGSIWGFLYLSGGNLAECFVSGRIAGERAAMAAPATSTFEHPHPNPRRST